MLVDPTIYDSGTLTFFATLTSWTLWCFVFWILENLPMNIFQTLHSRDWIDVSWPEVRCPPGLVVALLHCPISWISVISEFRHCWIHLDVACRHFVRDIDHCMSSLQSHSPILNTLLFTSLRSSSQKTHCHLQNVLNKLHHIRWHLRNIHFPCRELWRNMLKDNWKIRFDQCASIQNRQLIMCSDVNVCTASSSLLKKQDCEDLNTTLVSEREGVGKWKSY